MKVEASKVTHVETKSPETVEAAETAGDAKPPVADTVVTADDEPRQELGGKDSGANKRPGPSDVGDTDLDAQVSKFRLEARLGDKTIAKPRDVAGGSPTTVEAGDAKDVEAAGKDLDDAMARGRRTVAEAGRKAAGRKPVTSDVDEGVDVVGMTVDVAGATADLVHAAKHGGAELASKGALGLGVAGVGASAVGVYTGIGGAHQDAHAFNDREGYQNGYAKGYAAGLYGEAQPRRRVKAADNSKKQTYDFAHNAGTRRGHADAMRLSDEDNASARMYIESKMADNNEDHLWGNSDVAGAYVKREGVEQPWYTGIVP
jgi:hypothetical protein